MNSNQLIDVFQRARKDTDSAVIEGVQAIKHAARFQAQFINIITCDLKQLEVFLTELAPDIKSNILSIVEEVSQVVFNKLSPQPPRTQVIAIAHRRSYQLQDLYAKKPIVFLEDPRDLENIGAVIRVAAAADVAGVCITGPADIWHPAVIRGAAGLQFAVPVFNIDIDDILQFGRPLISLDPTGEELNFTHIPTNAIFIFGTERHGISKQLLAQSNKIIRLPMKSGVSSLNLATSVAAILYRLP